MKPTITAIIAHMPLSENLLQMTRQCVKDIRPLVDKLILIQNGAGKEMIALGDWELAYQVDHYLINKHNRLHAGAINQGAALARPGEYLAFINDDIFKGSLTRDELEKCCVSGEIWSPQIADQAHSYTAHASFFVCDYETFFKVGYWDLTLGHQADEDWFKRAVDLGIPMHKIAARVEHDHPAATISKVEAPTFQKGEY